MRVVKVLVMLVVIGCSAAACSNDSATSEQRATASAEKLGVRPLGVPTCADCMLLKNGGNGIVTGAQSWNPTPTNFYTSITVYDSSWAPHTYHPFSSNTPNGWFWQGMPSHSTSDVIAATIDWVYYAGSFWWTDGAPLMIQE